MNSSAQTYSASVLSLEELICFFTNEIFILIFFPGKKISKKVDARHKWVDSDSEEELAAAQNTTFPPDDPGKNIELFFGTEEGVGGVEAGDYVWIVQAAA